MAIDYVVTGQIRDLKKDKEFLPEQLCSAALTQEYL